MAETIETIRIEEDTSGIEAAAANVRSLEARLNDTQKALKAMSGATSINIADFRALKEQAQDLQSRLAGASQEFLKLGGTNTLDRHVAQLKKVELAAKEAAAAEKKLADEAKRVSDIRVAADAATKRRLSDEARRISDNQQKFAAFKFNQNVRQAQERRAAESSAGSGGGGLLSSVGGEAAIASGALAIGAALFAAAAAITAAGAKLAISSTSFRENTEKSFEFLLGSASAARDLYEKALDVADEVGLAKETVVASLKEMLLAGFGQDEAIAAIKAAGNLAQVVGEAGAAQLLEVFKKAKAGGTFGEREIKALKALGIQTAEVYAQLAKQTGKSLAEVQQLVKAGLLSADEGIKAVEATINAKLGGAGEKAGKSFDRLLGDVIGNFERLFDDVDLGPLKDAFENVINELQGPAGERMRSGINKIFGGLFDALFGAFDEDRVEGLMNALADAFETVGDIVVAAAPSVKAFIGAIVDGFLFIWPAIKAVGGAIATVAQKMQEWGIAEPMLKGLGYAVVALAAAVAVAVVAATLLLAPLYLLIGVIGLIIAGIVWLIETVSDLGSAFDEIDSAILSSLTDFISGGEGLGSGIIDGLVAGITGGASGVVSSMVSVVTEAIGAAKSALGMRSPSAVGKAIGLNLGGSVAMGQRESIPDVKAAARDLANASVPSNDNAAGGVRSSIPDVKAAARDLADAATPSNDNAGGGAPRAAAATGGAINVHINHTSPPVTMPPGATPEEAQKIGAAFNAGDQEKFNRMLMVALRTL